MIVDCFLPQPLATTVASFIKPEGPAAMRANFSLIRTVSHQESANYYHFTELFYCAISFLLCAADINKSLKKKKKKKKKLCHPHGLTFEL